MNDNYRKKGIMIKVLSDRENEVVAEISKGNSVKEIASNLFLSPHTIDTHIKKAKRKTGARTLAGLTRIFILSLDDPKQYFRTLVAIMFIGVQSIFIFSMSTESMRSPNNSYRTQKVARRTKKIKG